MKPEELKTIANENLMLAVKMAQEHYKIESFMCDVDVRTGILNFHISLRNRESVLVAKKKRKTHER